MGSRVKKVALLAITIVATCVITTVVVRYKLDSRILPVYAIALALFVALAWPDDQKNEDGTDEETL